MKILTPVEEPISNTSGTISVRDLKSDSASHCSMSFFAVSHFDCDLAVMMSRLALSAATFLAASSPKPVFVPVIRTVLPANDSVQSAGGDRFS